MLFGNVDFVGFDCLFGQVVGFEEMGCLQLDVQVDIG